MENLKIETYWEKEGHWSLPQMDQKFSEFRECDNFTEA